MPLPSGTRLGRYEIRSPLGAGGMGEVYLAQDTQLRRAVALKVLPLDVTSNADRLRRFEQEAYAASALNHPNIITIYEVGRLDGTYFIATEFIDGVTLRDTMTGGRVKVGEVLETTIQVASALATAHEAGIIHRDIKPENIMLRRDGYAKVLDFGLAKLNERGEGSASDPEAQTMIRDVTEPGVIMGTARYMSPEQARAGAVDERTDIWSLGCVIYELLAGRTPFDGPTYSHVIVAVLEDEPPPLSTFAPSVPHALETIIMKALAKDPAARYQTAKEFCTELRQLKNKLDFEAELELSVQPNRDTLLRMSGTARTGQRINTGQAAANQTEKLTAAHSTLTTRYLARELIGTKQGLALVVLLTLFIGGVALGIRQLFFTRREPAFQAFNLTRLTTTGKATDATISPDGKYVVHVVADGNGQSLWLRHVATSSNVPIVAPAEVQYRGLTFSPDGDFVYYVVREGGTIEGALYQVPVLGGTPKKLLTGINWHVTFSPDGKQFAYINEPQPGAMMLMVANADGSARRRIESPQLPKTFWSPAWSPDGDLIACAAVSQSGGLAVSVIGVRIKDGSVTPLTAQRWFDIKKVAWMSDGSGLMVTATPQWSGFSNQIEFIAYPGGETHRVTNDLSNYNGLGLMKDSGALVTVQAEQRSSIWTIAAPGSTPAQITSGLNKYDGVYDLSWTPDGKIVYESTASGDEDIWVIDADGNNPKQLTEKAGVNLFPSVSPDGKYVVFTSTRAGGNTNIWRMNADGTDQKQLTSGQIELFPSVSSDGRWVVYMSNVSGQRTVWKVSIDGGQPVQLIASPSWRPVVSPDNKWVAAYYREPSAGPQIKVAVVPLDGGSPVKILDIQNASPNAVPAPLRWTPDGRAITHIVTRGGISNLWNQPIDGGAPVPVTDIKSAGRIYSFDWSRDGKRLACSLGADVSDVVLLNDRKKSSE
ncbi:MAG TPA: protein kinase [Pyrinomonadaceae bacterium]|nr:protein kinase [Pyrinomonadaceae bacterium]